MNQMTEDSLMVGDAPFPPVDANTLAGSSSHLELPCEVLGY